MKGSTKLGVATALAASLIGGAAQAQDMREFDETASARSTPDDGVRMRLTLPFGRAEADRDEPRLAFGLARGAGDGGIGQFDLFSFSLAGSTPRVETPFALNAAGDGEGGWFSRPTSWLILGLGVGVAYAIYDHNQDDGPPPPPPPM